MSASPAAAAPPALLGGAEVAQRLGEAMVEAVHVMSSPLNSLQLGMDMQGTLLDRGRLDEARRNATMVSEELERVVDLVRLMRDWASACRALPSERVGDRLIRPLRARADAQTRMFIDRSGESWIGGRADGLLGFVIYVLVDIAFEQGALDVELDAKQADGGAEIEIRAEMPRDAVEGQGRHALMRVRRVLLDGVLAAAGAECATTQDVGRLVTRVRFHDHAPARA